MKLRATINSQQDAEVLLAAITNQENSLEAAFHNSGLTPVSAEEVLMKLRVLYRYKNRLKDLIQKFEVASVHNR